jgi:hypothetical protein
LNECHTATRGVPFEFRIFRGVPGEGKCSNALKFGVFGAAAVEDEEVPEDTDWDPRPL